MTAVEIIGWLLADVAVLATACAIGVGLALLLPHRRQRPGDHRTNHPAYRARYGSTWRKS